MARAISLGIDKNESQNFHFILFNPSSNKAESLAQELKSSSVCYSLDELPVADIYFIGCKPQQFSSLALNLKDKLPENAIAFSIMAALDITTIGKKLQHGRVMRIMPNTLARISMGISLFASSSEISKKEQAEVKSYFSSAMEFLDIPEEKFDLLTPLLGSGSAFVYWLLEQMEEFARAELAGIVDEKTLAKIFKKLLYGSALLAIHSEEDNFSSLIAEIRSKKGITDACLIQLNAEGKTALYRAVQQGQKRAKELSLETEG